MSSPSRDLVMMGLMSLMDSYFLRRNTSSSAAAMAMWVLPVPALPTTTWILTSSSMAWVMQTACSKLCEKFFRSSTLGPTPSTRTRSYWVKSRVSPLR